MPPVAKAAPLEPDGEKEAVLLEAVDAAYGNRMEFFRAVATKTRKKPSTEKSHFNRIVHGHQGDQTAWRIRIYARILERDASDFLRPSEALEGAVAGRRPKRLTLRSLSGDLAELTRRVDELAELVIRLGAQGQSGSQAQGPS